MEKSVTTVSTLEQFVPGLRDLIVAKLTHQRDEIQALLDELQPNGTAPEKEPGLDAAETYHATKKMTEKGLGMVPVNLAEVERLRKKAEELLKPIPATQIHFKPRGLAKLGHDELLRSRADKEKKLPTVTRAIAARWAQDHGGIFDCTDFRQGNQGKYRTLDAIPYVIGASMTKSGQMKKLGPGRYEITAVGRKLFLNA